MATPFGENVAAFPVHGGQFFSIASAALTLLSATASREAAVCGLKSFWIGPSGQLPRSGAENDSISVEKVLHGDGGRRSYVLGFTPDDVPPGEYTLRIHIGESTSVLQSYTRLRMLPRETADRR